MEELLGFSMRENNPRTRRHTTANLSSFFKTQIGGAFLSFFQSSLQKKRPSLQQTQQTIKQTMDKINQIIETVDQHITQRLTQYQQQLFGIVQDEVADMKVQTDKLISDLNDRIKAKSVEDSLWHLNNQLDYFKNVAFRLFQENRDLKVRIKVMDRKGKEEESQRQCLMKVMAKIKKKQLRNSSKAKELDILQEEIRKTQAQPPRNQTNNNNLPLKHTFLKHTPEEKHNIIQNESRIDIQLPTAGLQPDQNLHLEPPHPNQSRKESQQSIPSLILRQSDNNSLMPPVHLVKVESFDINENSIDHPDLSSEIYSKIIEDEHSILSSVKHHHKQKQTHNRGTQTQTFTINIKPPADPDPRSQRYLQNYSDDHPKCGRAKRCNTQKNIQVSYLSQCSNSQLQRQQEKGKLTFRVVHNKKPSKNVMYMSNALTNNRLKVDNILKEKPKDSRRQY